MKILQWLTELLYPEKCVLCGKLLEKEELDLCRQCRIEAPVCNDNRKKYSFVDSWTAVWYYQDPVRRSVLRYKFYGRRNYAAAYARMLGVKLLQQERTDVDLITWVPISKQRLKKRGYDQCQLLAEHLSRELEIPAVPLLKKIYNNPPQSGVVGYAQRRANVLGVYTAMDPQLFAGKRILLLDDILTTGATAGECARVLLTAGAEEVHLGVIAVADHSPTNKTGR